MLSMRGRRGREGRSVGGVKIAGRRWRRKVVSGIGFRWRTGALSQGHLDPDLALGAARGATEFEGSDRGDPAAAAASRSVGSEGLTIE